MEDERQDSQICVCAVAAVSANRQKKAINLNENLFFPLLIVKEICPDDFGVDPTKKRVWQWIYTYRVKKKKKIQLMHQFVYIFFFRQPSSLTENLSRQWLTFKYSTFCQHFREFLLFFCERAKTCHLKARCRENECCARHPGSSIGHPDATSQRSLWRKKKKCNNHRAGEHSELLKHAQVTQLSWDDFRFLQHTEGERKKLKGQAEVCFNIWSLSNLLLTCAQTLGTETVLTVNQFVLWSILWLPSNKN